jgi:hypothetical protein
MMLTGAGTEPSHGRTNARQPPGTNGNNSPSTCRLAACRLLAYSLVSTPRAVVRLMHRILFIVAGAGFLWAGVLGAQAKPDFSGVRALDGSRSEDRGVYGQMRVITQGPAEISMAVLHVASGRISITPWRLAFDRWRPRRGSDQSLERGLSRSFATGGTAAVSLTANSVIEPAIDAVRS